MNPAVASALAFIKAHGVVLESAKGPAPRLIEAIAGETVSGNWWSHPKAKYIYHVLSEVRESEHVLACRLINGKVTLVHRRLWPALVRSAGRFAPRQICQLREEHTTSGHHVTHEVPFPEWVPQDVVQQAEATAEADALALFERWLQTRAPQS